MLSKKKTRRRISLLRYIENNLMYIELYRHKIAGLTNSINLFHKEIEKINQLEKRLQQGDINEL